MARASLASLIGFLAACLLCVSGVARGAPMLGVACVAVFCVVHLALAHVRRPAAFTLVAASVGVGFVVEAALVHAGLRGFVHGAMSLSGVPLWVLAVWAALGATLQQSGPSLTPTPLRSFVTGALGGPLLALAGERAGVLSPSGAASLVITALVVGSACVLLMQLVRATASLRYNASTLRRRVVSVTRMCVGFLIIAGTLPVLLPLAVVVDCVRLLHSRVAPTAARLLLFIAAYLVAEVVGLLALAVSFWARGDDLAALTRDAAAIQRSWVGMIFAAVSTLFLVRIDLEGDEVVDVAIPGPVLVFVRHASIVDSLFPSVVVTRRRGRFLRFVLKRELLADPCFDICGHRLPNHFVRRDQKGSADELAAVRELATGVGDDEGLLIFPEGTRFSPARRDAALARLAGSPLEARARALTHVLPPRIGGPLALLDGAPHADVVIVAHHGLEGLQLFSDVWNGGLVRRSVRLKLWRIARADVPNDETGRIDWLYRTWADVDAWVAAQLGPPTTHTPAPSPSATQGSA